jgi:hypothetical protein
MSDPLSFSVWVDNKAGTAGTVGPAGPAGTVGTVKVVLGIQPRVRQRWVEDETVLECTSCLRPFSVWFRRHHCRICCQIFCDECANNFIVVPPDIPIGLPVNGVEPDRNVELRVCNACCKRTREHVARKTRFVNGAAGWGKFVYFMEWVSNINDLKRLACVNKDYHSAASAVLSRFRELQYATLPPSAANRRLLWHNRRFFVGHSKWMAQLIRSIDYESTVGMTCVDEVLALLTRHNQCQITTSQQHWSLMCTRSCGNGFRLEDIVCMIHVPNQRVRAALLDLLDTIPFMEWLNFIPHLVHHITTADCAMENNELGRWLIKWSCRDAIIANKVYWCLLVNVRGNRRLTYWMERWMQSMDRRVSTPILQAHAFSDGCAKLTKLHRSVDQQQPKHVMQFMSSQSTNAFSPIHPDRGAATIDVERVCVKDSITRPIVIPLIWTREKQTSLLLYKPEDVRKDHIVMCFIRLADQLLKRDLGVDFCIKTYDVWPTSADSGFIEMVPDSTTFYSLYTEHKRNIFNFVSGTESVDVIRDRFMKSCAAYCVLTYLLGAGDRHQDNIMLTRKGELFHIDYGYVMGADPKRHIPGFGSVPDMRIDVAMVDILGPDENFMEFKRMVDSIYNCLRRHIEPLTAILRLLVISEPPIFVTRGFNNDRLNQEILKRFLPSENTEKARIHINNRVDSSTQSTTYYAIVDSLHHQARSSTMVKVVASTWHSIKRTLF